MLGTSRTGPCTSCVQLSPAHLPQEWGGPKDLGFKRTLLAHVEFLVNQHPQVLLTGAKSGSLDNGKGANKMIIYDLSDSIALKHFRYLK